MSHSSCGKRGKWAVVATVGQDFLVEGVPRFDPGLGVSRRSSLPRYHSPAQQKKKKKNSYAPIFTGPRYTIYHIPHYTSLYIHWVFKVSGQQICIKNIVISRQPLLYLHTPIYLRSYRRNPHIRNVSYSIVKAILLKFILWDSLHTYVATFLGNY